MSEQPVSEVVPDDALPPGEWLSPAAAASHLGVSERTLWRLVGKGRYHRRVVDRKAQVLVPTSAPLPDTGATFPAAQDAPSVSGNLAGVPDTSVLAVVAELRRQHESTQARIAAQDERIAALERENGALTARLLALTAPESPPAAPGATIAEKPTADTRSVPSALWERWLLAVIVLVVVLALVLLFVPR